MRDIKKVYHHTAYDTLRKIVNTTGICFRGSYYEKFDSEDYSWTKEYVSSIIEKICIDRGYEYTKDSSFKPIIISFNQEARSDYMWNKYADEYRGVQLIFDYEIIRTYAKNHLDYFNECVYMSSQEEIETYLEESMDILETISVNDYQGNLEALSGLIKREEYRLETEIRYVHPYTKILSVNYNDYIVNGEKAFQEITPEDDNDEELYIQLPKDVLRGITIGYKSSDKLEEIKCYLQKCGFDTDKMEITVLCAPDKL